MPLISSIAVRRNTAHDPQKKVAFQRSAVLHQAVKQFTLIRHFPEQIQISLERVGGIEKVRRLHHGQMLVFDEPAHGHLQEGSGRHVIAIKNRDELSGGLGKRDIDVAGFGVFVGGAGDVAATGLFGELPKFLAAAVVQDVNAAEFGRPIDIHGRPHGLADHAERFVVTGDEEIDAGPLLRVARKWNGLAFERPNSLKKSEHQNRVGVQLGAPQDDHEDHVQRLRLRPAFGAEAEGFGEAVVDVTRR